MTPKPNLFYLKNVLVIAAKIGKRNTRKMCEICSKLIIAVSRLSSLIDELNKRGVKFCFPCLAWQSRSDRRTELDKCDSFQQMD